MAARSLAGCSSGVGALWPEGNLGMGRSAQILLCCTCQGSASGSPQPGADAALSAGWEARPGVSGMLSHLLPLCLLAVN